MSENINVLICPVNWIDHEDSAIDTFDVGNEEPNFPQSNLLTKAMSNTWRTVGMNASNTRVLADYGLGQKDERFSRAVLAGNVNFPGDGQSLIRVRKFSEGLLTQRLPPVMDDGAGAHQDAFISSTNVTGTPSLLLEDPIDATPTTDAVTPTTEAANYDFTLRFREPFNAVDGGTMLVDIEVAYAANSTTDDGSPTMSLSVYQNGVDQSISDQWSDLYDDGGTSGRRMVRFDAQSLDDPTLSKLEAKISTLFVGSENIKIESVCAHITYANQHIAVPINVTGGTWLTSTNATGASTLARIATDDPFKRVTGSVTPTVATSPMILRQDFKDLDQIGNLHATNKQYFVVQYENTLTGTSPTLEVFLFDSAADMSISAFRTNSELQTQRQWLWLEWEKTDLNDQTGAGVEIKIETTPDGSGNIEIFAMGWVAALTEDAWEMDTGWVDLVATPTDAEFTDVILPDDVGNQIMTSKISLTPYTVGGTTLSTQYTLIELYRPGDNFTDRNGNTIDYLELGRVADCPGISGPWLQDGFEAAPVDLTIRQETIGGQVYEDIGDNYQLMSIRLSEIPSTVAVSDFFDFIFRRMGLSGDLLLVILPEEDDVWDVLSVWGPHNKEPRLTHDTGLRFRAQMQIRERL